MDDLWSPSPSTLQLVGGVSEPFHHFIGSFPGPVQLPGLSRWYRSIQPNKIAFSIWFSVNLSVIDALLPFMLCFASVSNKSVCLQKAIFQILHVLHYCRIPSSYLTNTGLTNEYIYHREFVKKQCEFLKETVVDESSIGWIVGPPGTGKSTSSFLFAMQLDRSQWVITWLSLSKLCAPVATCFVNDNKQTLYISGSMDKLSDMFCTFISRIQSRITDTEKKNHIVFIDGVTHDHVSLCQSFVTWIGSKDNCRLVFVSSVASRKSSKVHEDTLYHIKEFFVCSWTIDEYRSAFENNDFCQSVLKYFDSSQELKLNSSQTKLSNEELEELIVSKHYFAGGSSRFMFGMPTDDVVRQLELGIMDLHDVTLFLKH